MFNLQDKAKSSIIMILFFILAAIAPANADAGKPQVIEFYASWAKPCQELEPAMQHARAEYGKKVDFVSYDVDDPKVRDLVKKYEVCPIPTVIFLDKDSNVSSYMFGLSSERVIEKGINKILAPELAAKNSTQGS